MITRIPVVVSSGKVDRFEWNGSSTWGTNSAAVLGSAPGKMIQLPVGTTAIAVDPALTTPNVVVGICRDDSGRFIYLRPGEGMTFDQPTDRCYVMNPHLAQFARTINLLTGGCALNNAPAIVVLQAMTSSSDLLAYRANRNRPLPVAAPIAWAYQTTANLDPSAAPSDPTIGVCFATGGLEKVRVSFVFWGAGIITTPPADLAGTVRVYCRTRAGAVGGAPVNIASIQFPDLDGGGSPNIDTVIPLWGSDPSKDMVLSQTKFAFDLDLGASSDAIYFRNAVAITGTGLTNTMVMVTAG